MNTRDQDASPDAIMHAVNVTLCDDTVKRFEAGDMTNDEEHELLAEMLLSAQPIAPSEVESAT